MRITSAFGLKGDKGDAGNAATVAVGTVTTGTAAVTNSGTATAAVFNFTIPPGSPGNNGNAATITLGTVTGLAAGATPTVTNSGTSSAAVFNFGIPTSFALATVAPLAPGTPAVGTSAKAAKEDHVHPAQSGVLTSLGNYTVGETLIVGLSLGVKRYSVTVAGAAIGDRLMLALTGAPANGTLQDAYVTATNTVSIGLLIPALGIGATIAVPLVVYKVT